MVHRSGLLELREAGERNGRQRVGGLRSYNQTAAAREARTEKGSGKTLLELSSPRKPITGTIARGYAGGTQPAREADRGVNIKPNGSVPYYYEDTEHLHTIVKNTSKSYHLVICLF